MIKHFVWFEHAEWTSKKNIMDFSIVFSSASAQIRSPCLVHHHRTDVAYLWATLISDTRTVWGSWKGHRGSANQFVKFLGRNITNTDTRNNANSNDYVGFWIAIGDSITVLRKVCGESHTNTSSNIVNLKFCNNHFLHCCLRHGCRLHVISVKRHIHMLLSFSNHNITTNAITKDT